MTKSEVFKEVRKCIQEMGFDLPPEAFAAQYRAEYGNEPANDDYAAIALCVFYAVTAYVHGRDGFALEDLFPWVRPIS